MHIIRYFEFDDYGKYHHPKKEAKTYDVKNKYKLFLTRPVFKAYNSTYMKVLNINSPWYQKGQFNSYVLSTNEMKYIFRDKI